MKCPVCDRENMSMLCLRCGFDASRDYGKYETFAPIGRTAAVSALRKLWQEQQAPTKREKPVSPAYKGPQQQPNCGTPVKDTTPPAPKNKWIAFFLCLYLGVFGCHKFYEGKKGMGFLYLCTVGLFGYGWLFDTIALLFKPNPYFPNISQSRRNS